MCCATDCNLAVCVHISWGLSVMANDQGPVVQSAMLRSELVRLRHERELTQEAVARALEWHPSKLIRIEGGKSNISRTDLQALLREYGVTSESRQERLHALSRGARTSAWWSEYQGKVSEQDLTVIGYEAGAAVIRQFQYSSIPGLLQRREYAEVLVANYVEHRGSAEQVVELRMRRGQELARREPPPRQYYVLDEAAIRRHVGVRVDPQIMPDQLHHVADIAESDSLVTIRVVPFAVGAHAGLSGSFTLMEFDGAAADLLFIESSAIPNAQSTFTSDEALVADYQDAFESIVEEAISEQESIRLIRSIADELKSGGHRSGRA